MSFKSNVKSFFANAVYLAPESIQHLIAPVLDEVENKPLDFSLFETSAYSVLDEMESEHSALRKKHLVVSLYIFAYQDSGPFRLICKLHELMFCTDEISNWFNDDELISNIDDFLKNKPCCFSSLVQSSSEEAVEEEGVFSEAGLFESDSSQDVDLDDLISSFSTP